MLIIGCDFHSGFQQLAIFDNQTGEVVEKKLLHAAEAMVFYQGQSEPVRVGMESGSPCQWFRRLLSECGHELWIGDAARIRAAEVRRQKTDRRDAGLILKLLLEERFPRIWVPSEAERDVRQLLLDRHHRMRMRTLVKNQLQSLALNQGLQKGRKLWSEAGREQLRALPMMEHAARRRDQLLQTASRPAVGRQQNPCSTPGSELSPRTVARDASQLAACAKAVSSAPVLPLCTAGTKNDAVDLRSLAAMQALDTAVCNRSQCRKGPTCCKLMNASRFQTAEGCVSG
jgi:hypothetical protein